MISTPARFYVAFQQFFLAGLFLLIVIVPPSIRADASTDAYDKGVEAFKNKNYDLAIADFSEAIGLNQNNAAAYNERGRAYKNKSAYDKAIADFNDSIRLNPNNALAYLNRGLIYANKRDYDEAIADFNDAIRLNPDYADAYNNRGTASLFKNDYDKALADFDKALRLNPSFFLVYDNRGIAYNAKHDYDKAIADFNDAIRLNPNDAPAYHNRGLSYDEKCDYNEAIADFHSAIRLNPNYSKAYFALARLLAVCPDDKIRDGDKAVVYAKRACELTTWKDAVAIDMLAAAYAEAGNFDEAVKWENKVLEFKLLKEFADAARQRLSLYEQKKPYHEKMTKTE